MRIITGTARGIQLETLPGDATRPTTERVKEALFSMIQFDIEGRRVLDLFAGSGQLGLEALSRGAAHATFIDMSRDAVNVILKNAAATRLKDRARVAAMDFKAYLSGIKPEGIFDIIFLDPPYNTSCMKEALSLIRSVGALREGGWIVCETDTEVEERKKKKKRRREEEEDVTAEVASDVFDNDSELMSSFELVKSTRYGRTRITLLTTK